MYVKFHRIASGKDMNSMQMNQITWSILKFEEFTPIELYNVLRLRQKVFVVEQNCAYLDCDNADQNAHHLLASYTKNLSPELVAYLRVLIPESQDEVPRIGRLLCHFRFRKSGIGAKLMQKGISHCSTLFPGSPIKISAQQYLVTFYTDLGFRVCSAPYDEDGIPHIEMVYEHAVTSPTGKN